MNDREYNALEGIRRSDLWVINKTPAHFKYNLTHPQEKTEALLFGSAIHKLLLEPMEFTDEYAVLPDLDRRTTEGKLKYAEFIEQNKDKEIISLTAIAQINDMVRVLQNDELVSKLLYGSKKEQVYTWVDPKTGEPCKIKADAVTTYEGKPVLIDYKTTQSCEVGAFERSAKKYGYDFQAGMYCAGVEANTMERYGFIFIAQEKTPPYLHRVYFCSPEFIEAGKAKFIELLSLYHNCKVKDEWLGYEPTDLLGEYY